MDTASIKDETLKGGKERHLSLTKKIHQNNVAATDENCE